MGRSSIFEGIFGAVSADMGILSLLGPRTATNLRIYRNFVQLQSLLKGPPVYEPSAGEGWLVLEESPPGLNQSRAQYDSIFEVMDVNFHVFSQLYGIADDVFDYLDTSFHWSVEQQRDVQYGDYFLFFTRAFQTGEKYAEEVKLAQKTRQYRMEFILAEQVA